MKKKIKIIIFLFIILIIILSFLYICATKISYGNQIETNQLQERMERRINEFIEFTNIPLKLVHIEPYKDVNIKNIGIVVEEIIESTHFVKVNFDVDKTDIIPLNKIRDEFPHELIEYKNLLLTLIGYEDVILKIKWNFYPRNIEFDTLAVSRKDTSPKFEPIMYMNAVEKETSENPHNLIIRNVFRMPVIRAELFIDIVSTDVEHIITYNSGVNLSTYPLWKAKSINRSLNFTLEGIDCINSEAKIIWASGFPKFRFKLKEFEFEAVEGIPGSVGENVLFLRKCASILKK